MITTLITRLGAIGLLFLIAVNVNAQIQLNQVGYFPEASKLALVPVSKNSKKIKKFEIVAVESGEVVFRSSLGKAGEWTSVAEGVVVKPADFSEFKQAGHYFIRVKGVADSPRFHIADDVYRTIQDAAIKSYYFNRAGQELLPEFAGEFARPLGHPDTNVLVFEDAVSTSRPEGASFSSPKGWYDAGDYGKYVVNSGISTYTLLAAYENFQDQFKGRSLNIPESSNDRDDFLDEILWNLDWMETMQDPEDGSVFHKLTTLRFSGREMPHEANEQRYFIGKSTSAALDFSAVMAVASRVFRKQGDADRAQRYLIAAEKAWAWAIQNPGKIYRQHEEVKTGAYGDFSVADEFLWASAELFLATGKDQYRNELLSRLSDKADVAAWSRVGTLAFISLARHGQELLGENHYRRVLFGMRRSAASIIKLHDDSIYKVGMEPKDFVWGSNGVALNKAMLLMEYYAISNEPKYRDAAQALLDYVLGKNPTHYSFVTGFGDKSTNYPHHRPSDADSVEAAIPGFVAGGPQPAQQDKCDYPSNQPAMSYLDHWCSYSTNEIAINWNAPFVYVVTALQASY